MKSTTTYAIRYSKTELCKLDAWTLFEVVTPELGEERWMPIAFFNLESEADRFMSHLFLDHQARAREFPLIAIPAEMQRKFESIQRLDIKYPRNR